MPQKTLNIWFVRIFIVNLHRISHVRTRNNEAMIAFEKEVLEYLGLPSIPLKEHDGVTSFERGVAVLELYGGQKAYAVAAFNAEKDKKVRVVKAFSVEPFSSVSHVYVVPSYMARIDDVKDMDLDEASKKKAEQVLNEASEMENEGVEPVEMPTNEYVFDFIHNDEEARAFIEAHNKRNKIKGKIPTTHEGLVMRLSVIFHDTTEKNK